MYVTSVTTGQAMDTMSPLWDVKMSMSAQMETSPIIVDPIPSAQTQLAPSVVPVSLVISSFNERMSNDKYNLHL